MSFVRKKSFIEKLSASTSLRNLAFNFFKDTLAGQKIFLYHQNTPRVVNISFNEYTCMYKCRMCPYHEDDTREAFSQKSEMSFETLKNIVNCIPNDSHYSFDMSSIGETLLFKELPEFISYMKKKRPKVNTVVSTNALPLTGDVFLELAKSGLDNLQLSLYAQNATDHSHVTGTDTYERVAENVRRAGELKKSEGLKNPFMQAFMFGTKEMIDTADEFIQQWTPYVDQAFVRPVSNVGRPIDGMTAIWQQPIPKKRYPCVQPWYSTSIDSKGDVYICRSMQWRKGLENIVVGNINKNTIQEIWQSPEFLKIRDAQLNQQFGDFPVCVDCDSWASYTNIWDSENEPGFQYSGTGLKDFFKKETGYRGG